MSLTLTVDGDRWRAHLRAVAEAVAVLGDGARTGEVVRLAGVGAADAGDAVAALVRDQTLEHAGGLAFVHPVIRAAVYQGLAPYARNRLHRDAARLVTEGVDAMLASGVLRVSW